MTLDIAAGTTECGVLLRASDDGDSAYILRLEPKRGRMVFDRWPRRRTGDGQWEISGDVALRDRARTTLRPLAGEHTLEVIVDGDLCVANLDGRTTLSTRIYDRPVGRVGVFVGEGSIVVRDLRMTTAATAPGNRRQPAHRGSSHTPEHARSPDTPDQTHPNTDIRSTEMETMKTTRSRLAAIAAATALALGLTACGAGGGAAGNADSTNVNPEGEIKPREISWLLSRPADGGVITAMEQIAEEYATDHPGFALNLITTPDRPSYIQKYQTLAAANKLPELFDTDATPYAQKLAKQGRMMDAEALLEEPRTCTTTTARRR